MTHLGFHFDYMLYSSYKLFRVFFRIWSEEAAVEYMNLVDLVNVKHDVSKAHFLEPATIGAILKLDANRRHWFKVIS